MDHSTGCVGYCACNGGGGGADDRTEKTFIDRKRKWKTVYKCFEKSLYANKQMGHIGSIFGDQMTSTIVVQEFQCVRVGKNRICNYLQEQYDIGNDFNLQCS